MGRKISLALAFFMTCGARVWATDAVQVTASSLNVRTGPGTGYAILGVAGSSQVYAVADRSGSWTKIWWAGNWGWIYSAYTNPVSATGAQVTASSLNVRNGPSTSDAIVGQAHSGEIYVQTGTSGSWIRIWFGGAAEWIYGAYTTPTSLGAAQLVDYGNFEITYYGIAYEGDYDGPWDTPIYGTDWQVLATAPWKFVHQLGIEGTGQLVDGRYLNTRGGGRYAVVDGAYGSDGTRLSPFRAIAVDPNVIPLGSTVYIPAFDGMSLPDGTTHDGYFVAHDIGGGIQGAHIDIFVGRETNASAFEKVVQSTTRTQVFLVQ